MALIFQVIGNFQDNINAGMKQLNDNANKTNSALSGMGKTLKTVAGALGLAFGAQAAIKGIKNLTLDVIKLGDEIGKASQRVNLSVEEYQKWDYAMQLNGTSIQEVEKGLVKFQKNVVDAAEGIGDATDALETLGIQFKENDGTFRENGVLFEDTVLALADMEDITLRNAYAQKIFGQAGAKIAPLLNAGSIAILRQKRELEEMGAVVGKDGVTAAERFNDALLGINKVILKMKFDILVPILNDLSDKFENMLKSGELKKRLDLVVESAKNMYETFKEVSSFISENFVVLAIGAAVAAIPTLVGWIYSLSTAIIALNASMLSNPFVLAAAAIVVAGITIGAIWKDWNKALSTTASVSENAKVKAKELGVAFTKMSEEVAASNGDITETSESFIKAKNATNAYLESLGRTERVAGDFADQIKIINDVNSAANNIYDMQAKKYITLDEALSGIKNTTKKTTKSILDLTEAALKLKVAFGEIELSNIAASEALSATFDQVQSKFESIREEIKLYGDALALKTVVPEDAIASYTAWSIAVQSAAQDSAIRFKEYENVLTSLSIQEKQLTNEIDKENLKRIEISKNTNKKEKEEDLKKSDENLKSLEQRRKDVADYYLDVFGQQEAYNNISGKLEELQVNNAKAVREKAISDSAKAFKELVNNIVPDEEAIYNSVNEEFDVRRSAVEEAYTSLFKVYSDNTDIINLLIKEKGEDLALIQKEQDREQFNASKKRLNEYLGAVGAIQSAITAVNKAETSKRVAAYDAEIAMIDQSTEAGRQRARKVEEQKNRTIQASKEEFESRKRFFLALAIIQGAAAVVTAIKAGWDEGKTLYDKIALAIAAGAVATAQTVTDIATIASQSYQTGGFPTGRNSIVRVNEDGQEAILNARATASLGRDNINALNNGGAVGSSVSVTPTIIVQGNADATTVSRITDELDVFARKIETVFERGMVDTNRVAMAF